MTGNPQEGDSAPGNGRDERELPELDDDALVRRLGEAIERYDPVPEWVLALGRDSYELHNLDVELALLDREPSTAGAIRSSGQTELLSFDAGELSLEIEITGSGSERRLIGELDPPGPARIEVRQPSTPSTWVEADDRGRFTAGLAPGPVSVLCHQPGRRPIATEWVV